jgi:GH15 family glucan-1,4-alpha-glucosidase
MFNSQQSYFERTNILQTIFHTGLGTLKITDFMPVKGMDEKYPVSMLLRKVECLAGWMNIQVEFKPRTDYARIVPSMDSSKKGVTCRWGDETLFLHSPLPLDIENGEAKALLHLETGQSMWFSVQYGSAITPEPKFYENLFQEVSTYWNNWALATRFKESESLTLWHELAIRSSLVLKLLMSYETGGIAAAATTSLPEEIGGGRNWDYRFTWLRDSALSLQVLYFIGHEQELTDYFHWLIEIVRREKTPEQIKIMYSLQGKIVNEEKILPNLEGYKGSSPVRIGNEAVTQKQLDIYGELLNAVYDATRFGKKIDPKNWELIRGIVDYVCQEWNTKDSGIWEIRGGPRHYVYSKVMCWVTIDRGIRLATEQGFSAPLETWEKVKAAIHEIVLAQGFNKKLNSFVQSFGDETLDATSLLIPLLGFLPIEDPRVQGTIEATQRYLSAPHGLLYRYIGKDGLAGKEGCFLMCSFWLVYCLTLSGKFGEAEQLFGELVDFISPLGLYSEEIDPGTGEQIGNFPQAFTHLQLIGALSMLKSARGKGDKGIEPLAMHLQKLLHTPTHAQ